DLARLPEGPRARPDRTHMVDGLRRGRLYGRGGRAFGEVDHLAAFGTRGLAGRVRSGGWCLLHGRFPLDGVALPLHLRHGNPPPAVRRHSGEGPTGHWRAYRAALASWLSSAMTGSPRNIRSLRTLARD